MSQKGDSEDYMKQMQAELAEAKAAAAAALEAKAAAEKQAAEAEAALKKSGAPLPVKGAYKGYEFLPGRTRIRDEEGHVLDAQAVLDAANGGDTAAAAILDRLIRIGYSGLVKSAGKK